MPSPSTSRRTSPGVMAFVGRMMMERGEVEEL